MTEERIVAVALLTQAHVDMLGSSLHRVLRIDEGVEQFRELLAALNEPEGQVQPA
jgi:hypothetical protein